MTPPDEGISVGELSRRLSDTLVRIEGLARRLEDGQFVRTDLYTARQEAVNVALAALQDKVRDLDGDKAEDNQLSSLVARVEQLEDDKKWLLRLVIGFIILGVLGAIFIASGGTPQ